MCGNAFSEGSLMLKYCLDRYKIEEMCDKAVDNFLPTFKFFPNWFVTKKRLKNFTLLYSHMIISFFSDECSGNVTVLSDETGVLYGNLNYINLDG